MECIGDQTLYEDEYYTCAVEITVAVCGLLITWIVGRALILPRGRRRAHN